METRLGRVTKTGAKGFAHYGCTIPRWAFKGRPDHHSAVGASIKLPTFPFMQRWGSTRQ